MKNKELKAEVLSNGTYQRYTKTRKEALSYGHIGEEWSIVDDAGELVSKPMLEILQMTEDEATECERLRNNKNMQRRRIEEHIKFLVRSAQIGGVKLFFATFTFNEDSLKLTADTRKQAVRRIVSGFDDYILNVDYGKKNEREHYHGVLSIREGDYTITEQGKGWVKIDLLESYKYGYYCLQPIDIDDKMSAERIAKYIAKLVMHSVKVKQSKISTKKGSRYQLYKKLENRLATMVHDEGDRVFNKSVQIRRKMSILEDIQFFQMVELFGFDFDVKQES